MNRHDPTQAPSETEWCAFLAGCFRCRIDLGVCVTTGGITREQRREAAQARVIVITGIEEIVRIADQYGCVSPELEGPGCVD